MNRAARARLEHPVTIPRVCVEILKSLPDRSVDLVIADPPYLIGYTDRSGRRLANDDRPARVLDAFPELCRVLRQDRLCLCFYGWSTVDSFFRAWTDAGFRPVGHIAWHKPYASARGFLYRCHEHAYVLAKGRPAHPCRPVRDVRPWECTGNKAHPTQKAVSVIEPLITAFSPEGDLVLGPFAGSGSTCVAAALNGRRTLGMSLSRTTRGRAGSA